VKEVVFLINSTINPPRDVLLVELDVPLAQLSTSVLLARTPPSLLEVEFAQTALILALLVTELELAHHASADSTTSKELVNNLAPMEPIPSTEFVNVNQESFLLANV